MNSAVNLNRPQASRAIGPALFQDWVLNLVLVTAVLAALAEGVAAIGGA